ncbi:hypothetical protein Mapa_011994 [Marchantia paleacea]|nr:hypothetical protein Mapa_011994 [Marchantia paleacea]
MALPISVEFTAGAMVKESSNTTIVPNQEALTSKSQLWSLRVKLSTFATGRVTAYALRFVGVMSWSCI